MKIFLCSLILFVCVAFQFMLGVRYGVLEMQDDAIEAGVGEYYIDEDNTKQFRFVQPIPAEQNE